MTPIEISLLPDGRFTLASDPQRALSEAELRTELATIIADRNGRFVDGIVHWAKQPR